MGAEYPKDVSSCNPDVLVDKPGWIRCPSRSRWLQKPNIRECSYYCESKNLSLQYLPSQGEICEVYSPVPASIKYDCEDVNAKELPCSVPKTITKTARGQAADIINFLNQNILTSKGKLDGLEHQLKTVDRIAENIAPKLATTENCKKVEDCLRDALRFTVVFPEENYE